MQIGLSQDPCILRGAQECLAASVGQKVQCLDLKDQRCVAFQMQPEHLKCNMSLVLQVVRGWQ